MKKIFWVASYPKSGNTWLRAILSSLFFTKDGIFDFNLLNHIINFDNPDKYEFVRSLNNSDFLNLHELDIISKYWSEAQKRTNVNKNFSFFKTHSSNVVFNKFKYTENENVLGLIYILRDPRDVVISYSKHLGKSIDETITTITSKICITKSGLPRGNPYPILLGSWDIHYKSWQILEVPKLVIKYESLLNNTRTEINNIVNFFNKNFKFNLNNIDKKISNIIKTTNFKKLNETEKKFGFNENPFFYSNKKKSSNLFFRKGKECQWKEELNKTQIKKIEDSFSQTMIELGYLK